MGKTDNMMKEQLRDLQLRNEWVEAGKAEEFIALLEREERVLVVILWAVSASNAGKQQR